MKNTEDEEHSFYVVGKNSKAILMIDGDLNYYIKAIDITMGFWPDDVITFSSLEDTNAWLNDAADADDATLPEGLKPFKITISEV